jgi:hypothetical protein
VLARYSAATRSSNLGVSTPLLGLGRTLHARGKHGEAEPLLRESLSLRQDALPRGHWRIAQGEQALARCLAAQGRIDEAAGILRAGVQVLEDAPARRSGIERAAMLRQLIDLYEGAGRRAEAAPFRAALNASGAT